MKLRIDCAMPQTRSSGIPEKLNIAIATGSCVIALILLRVASDSESWLAAGLCAIGFSFVANTIFSCLHECVHGIFHSNRRVNDAFGILCAAFFPTGYSLQRAAHIGHHERNRSDSEMFDYYGPNDNRLLKFVQWYGIISGIYWFFVVCGWLIYLMCPFLFGESFWQGRRADVAEHTSGPAYARSFAAAPPLRARLELLFTIVFQTTVFLTLDLTPSAWLLCYAAFGINWSALQYADHAFSPLHVTQGAWDLRVHPWVQAIFLNYHLHLAHHRNPSVPWIHLPTFVDKDRPRPRFVSHYLRMWAGPRPVPPQAES
jgi:fatty acid desaturase